MHMSHKYESIKKCYEIERIMNAHIFLHWDPDFFLFFWGVLDMENTVRLLKKSKRSILFDADPIFKAVTAHAQISKKIFFTKMTNDE